MDKRNYKATFIINLRATTRSIEALTEWLKGVLAELGAEVTDSTDHGLKDYAYITNKQEPQGHFLSIDFSAQGDINATLQQRLKLEQEVKSILVELQDTAKTQA